MLGRTCAEGQGARYQLGCLHNCSWVGGSGQGPAKLDWVMPALSAKSPSQVL